MSPEGSHGVPCCHGGDSSPLHDCSHGGDSVMEGTAFMEQSPP